ncbi:MAG: hypothetical protein ABSA46_18560 [Thermodesulfovibrionales bacterium]
MGRARRKIPEGLQVGSTACYAAVRGTILLRAFVLLSAAGAILITVAPTTGSVWLEPQGSVIPFLH